MNRIKELESLISAANKNYYNDSSDVPDEQYDAWKDELLSLNPDSSLLKSVGAEPNTSKWIKNKHSIPMASLDKVNTEDQFKKWCSTRVENGFCVQEKLDGLSLSIDIHNGNYISATTRGDGVVGEDILRNVLKMRGIPKPPDLNCSIRGEIILTKSVWKKSLPGVTNPRNGASGISRRHNGSDSEYLTFIAYDLIEKDPDLKQKTECQKLEFLKSLGFTVPNYFHCPNISDVIDCRNKFVGGFRDSLDYDIDGIVIKLDNIEIQESFGLAGSSATGNPNGQVAFKFANEMRETTIRNVVWDVGLVGRVTPVAEFDPVLLSGASIARASLYNYRNVQTLGVSIGAKVLVSRRNEVIPAVEKVTLKSENPIIIPTNCPKCAAPLNVDGEYLVCINQSCPAVMQGNIQKWIENLEIDGIGPSLIEVLFQSGVVKTIPDLYKMKAHEIECLDRLGAKSAEKIINNLNNKKQMPLNIFLGSLNIPNCGRRVFESLIDQGYDSLDYITALLPAHFENVDGVGPKTAQDIYNGLKARTKLIADLLSVGITFGPFEEVGSKTATVSAPTIISGKKLIGMSFCFTGTMSNPRKVLETYVAKAGGRVENGVKAGLSYLVIADPSSTTVKANKARAFGTKLLSEQQFLDMLK